MKSYYLKNYVKYYVKIICEIMDTNSAFSAMKGKDERKTKIR